MNDEREGAREPACRVSIDHARSVLQEQRRLGAVAPDFQRVFPAEAIEPGRHVPVETVARFHTSGVPLLWFRPDRGAAVLDATRTGELAAVDATRLARGEEARVGRLAPATVEALGHRDVVLFLLHAGIIATYWHVGAELALETERRDGAAYEVDVSGTHEYFTNTRNTRREAFRVRIAGDGTVSVTGL